MCSSEQVTIIQNFVSMFKQFSVESIRIANRRSTSNMYSKYTYYMTVCVCIIDVSVCLLDLLNNTTGNNGFNEKIPPMKLGSELVKE